LDAGATHGHTPINQLVKNPSRPVNKTKGKESQKKEKEKAKTLLVR
jgi:hypothetical protein